MSEREIRFGGTVLDGNRHLCAFFHSEEEEFRAVLPFMADGMAEGDYVVYIVNADKIEEHRSRLTDGGIDVETAEQRGQLKVIGWPPKNRIEQSQMIDDLLNAARDHGYGRTRIVGDMDWASGNEFDDSELIALEARLHLIYSRHNAWIICAYDLSRFSGVAVIDVMRTHPAVLIGGVLQQNPFYIPAEQMLEELRERGEIES